MSSERSPLSEAQQKRSPLSEAQQVRLVALREAAEVGRARGIVGGGETKFSVGELIVLARYIESGEDADVSS